MLKPLPLITIVVALLAVQTQVVSAQEQDGSSPSVANYLLQIADAKLELAAANAEIAEVKLNAIVQLHQQGHASFRELTFAKLEHSRRQSSHRSLSEHRGFVAQAAAAQDKDGGKGDDNHPGYCVMITIPGMSGNAATDLVSRVMIPNYVASDRAVNLQRSIDQEFAGHRQSRTRAWQDLVDRLGKIDAVAGATNERTFAILNVRVAKAESTLERLGSRTIHNYATCDSTIDGQQLKTPLDWFDAVNANLLHWNQVAANQAAAAEHAHLLKLLSRVQDAARNNASPAGELQSVQAMVDSAAHRMQTRIDEAQDSRQRTQEQCDVVRQAAISRMLDAADAVKEAQQGLRSEFQRNENLKQLAAKDSYFQNELYRSDLSLALADASHQHAEFVHQQRIFQLDYVMARVGPHGRMATETSRSTWTRPLIELFTLRAKSRAKENLLRRKQDLAQWRVDGLHALKESGAATWKETMAAEVNLAESEEAADRAKADRIAAAAIVQLLVASLDSQETTPNENNTASELVQTRSN